MSFKVFYDEEKIESIVESAFILRGKSLQDVIGHPVQGNNRNRGEYGLFLEKEFYGMPPSSKSVPDFEKAGLELKMTPLVPRKKSKGGQLVRAKERLVLGKIDYFSIINEDYISSSLKKKCNLMLVFFYFYDKSVSTEQQVITENSPLLIALDSNLESVSSTNREYALENAFVIPAEDQIQIQEDWEKIKSLVFLGKAHELSEGDTFYLGACRKGAGGPNEKLKEQPNSTKKAKARAFCLKQSYMNQILAKNDAKIVSLAEKAQGLSIEKATNMKFERFIGLTVADISRELNFYKKNKNHKGFHRQLAMRMLDEQGRSSAELVKSGIELKTIRLKKSGKPRESMSFPGFEYLEIVNEEWEESSFFEKIESKFLFVIFQEDESGIEYLKKVSFWNMPYEDRVEAKRVWEDTKRRVKIDASDLPSMIDSPIAHVRPKGRNGEDKILTPQNKYLLRQCFWLNAAYIAKVVANL